MEVKQLGAWLTEPMTFTLTFPGKTTLAPGQSLDFTILVPKGTEPWRMWLMYKKVPPSNGFSRAWVFIKAFLHLSQQTQPKSFIAQSDEISR
jgi:hypothetical protein